MTELEKATEQYYKKRSTMNKLLIVFFVYLTLVVTAGVGMTAYQTVQISRNQTTNTASSVERFRRYNEANAREHQRTQQYVRCIGEALLKPISDRTAEDFDTCGVKVNGVSVTQLKSTGIVPTQSKATPSPTKQTTPPIEPKPAVATSQQPQAESTTQTQAPVETAQNGSQEQPGVLTRLLTTIRNIF